MVVCGVFGFGRAAFEVGDDCAGEVGKIDRGPGGDDVPVHDNSFIDPGAARVFHVVLDRQVAGGVLALEHAGGDQDPSAVADGGDEFACLIHVPDETDHFRVKAHVVRGEAARDNNGVKVGG